MARLGFAWQLVLKVVSFLLLLCFFFNLMNRKQFSDGKALTNYNSMFL